MPLGGPKETPDDGEHSLRRIGVRRGEEGDGGESQKRSEGPTLANNDIRYGIRGVMNDVIRGEGTYPFGAQEKARKDIKDAIGNTGVFDEGNKNRQDSYD